MFNLFGSEQPEQPKFQPTLNVLNEIKVKPFKAKRKKAVKEKWEYIFQCPFCYEYSGFRMDKGVRPDIKEDKEFYCAFCECPSYFKEHAPIDPHIRRGLHRADKGENNDPDNDNG